MILGNFYNIHDFVIRNLFSFFVLLATDVIFQINHVLYVTRK